MLSVKSENLQAAAPAQTSARPTQICRALLDALAASDGRRKRRQRNTTPDAIGMAIKRAMLERAVQDDPAPGDFEAWLLEYCHTHSAEIPAGALGATALQILEDWRLAQTLPQFRTWLDQGAPSEDKQ
jgi:hypothetical protein